MATKSTKHTLQKRALKAKGAAALAGTPLEQKFSPAAVKKTQVRKPGR